MLCPISATYSIHCTAARKWVHTRLRRTFTLQIFVCFLSVSSQICKFTTLPLNLKQSRDFQAASLFSRICVYHVEASLWLPVSSCLSKPPLPSFLVSFRFEYMLTSKNRPAVHVVSLKINQPRDAMLLQTVNLYWLFFILVKDFQLSLFCPIPISSSASRKKIRALQANGEFYLGGGIQKVKFIRPNSL